MLLRALRQTTDRHIYRTIMSTVDFDKSSAKFMSDRVELMLRRAQEMENVRSQRECLSFIGQHFRQYFAQFGKFSSDEVVGKALIDEYILVHCHDMIEKFDLLCFGMFVEYIVLCMNMDITVVLYD